MTSERIRADAPGVFAIYQRGIEEHVNNETHSCQCMAARWPWPGCCVPLLALFVYVALRSGPLAPVPVTVATVENRSISPALFGIGTVEARYTYKIGPTVAGRIKRVDVQVGDRVQAGQLLGEMDPVDLDDRIAAQECRIEARRGSCAGRRGAGSGSLARKAYAETQAKRYEQLLQARAVSEESGRAQTPGAPDGRGGLAAARANLDAAKQELARIRADREGLIQQRANLRLIAPVDGLVACARRRSGHHRGRRAGGGGSDRPGEPVDQCALRSAARIRPARRTAGSASCCAHARDRRLPGGCCAWSRWPMR